MFVVPSQNFQDRPEGPLLVPQSPELKASRLAPQHVPAIGQHMLVLIFSSEQASLDILNYF